LYAVPNSSSPPSGSNRVVIILTIQINEIIHVNITLPILLFLIKLKVFVINQNHKKTTKQSNVHSILKSSVNQNDTTVAEVNRSNKARIQFKTINHKYQNIIFIFEEGKNKIYKTE
jgi:hypothetical protein